jgi:hypothetical protein
MFWLLQNHSISIHDFMEVSTYEVSAPQAFLGILHLIPSHSPLYSWIISFLIIFSLFHMPKIRVTTKVSWLWEESLQWNVIFSTFCRTCLITHTWGKSCDFIHHNVEYVVWRNLMSNFNISIIQATINTTYSTLWWMNPQSLCHAYHDQWGINLRKAEGWFQTTYDACILYPSY